MGRPAATGSLALMRTFLLLLALALLTAACASSDPTPTTTVGARPAGPRGVVMGWIDAVIASDAEALADLVEPGGLVVLAAVENGFAEQQTVALLDSGMPPELLEDYWASFRAGFADFAGIPLQSIEVGGQDQFTLGNVPFSAVVIASGDGVTTVMAARRSAEWRLDLIGSFGAAFAAQLRRMLVNLSDTPDGDRIRDAYRTDVVPGLLAAFRRAPGNEVLGAELERMALLLER
jgi:hypothetical protein